MTGNPVLIAAVVMFSQQPAAQEPTLPDCSAQSAPTVLPAGGTCTPPATPDYVVRP